jgi:hypothetical protein
MPNAAQRSAAARPMPLAAPVMTAGGESGVMWHGGLLDEAEQAGGT